MDERLKRIGPNNQSDLPEGCCELCRKEAKGWALNVTLEERERCECGGRIIIPNLCWADRQGAGAMGINEIVYECPDCGANFYCKRVIKNKEPHCLDCDCPMILVSEEEEVQYRASVSEK